MNRWLYNIAKAYVTYFEGIYGIDGIRVGDLVTLKNGSLDELSAYVTPGKKYVVGPDTYPNGGKLDVTLDDGCSYLVSRRHFKYAGRIN